MDGGILGDGEVAAKGAVAFITSGFTSAIIAIPQVPCFAV